MLGLSLSTGRGLSGPIYSVDQVPENFKELFILSGYRHPKSSFTQCLLSVFDPTNETVNVWTHFVPPWYFLWILIQMSWSMDIANDHYTWPLFCYLTVCVAFPLASAVAHLFNVLSEHARHICFFLDYSALALFSFGVAVAYRAYSFPANFLSINGNYSWFRDNYVSIGAVNAVICTLLSCQTRFMKPSTFLKVLRLGSFSLPYFYDSIPILYRILNPESEESESALAAHSLYCRAFLFSAIAALLYTSHFPERVLPGKFDIIGHSHQLFHVATMIGVGYQLQAVFSDFENRRDFVEHHWPYDMAGNSLAFVLAVFSINLGIIVYFTMKLYYTEHKLKKCN